MEAFVLLFLTFNSKEKIILHDDPVYYIHKCINTNKYIHMHVTTSYTK